METTIDEIFANPRLDGCIVEYYPHVILQYENGGTLKNDANLDLSVFSKFATRDEKYTEYIHREKKLTVYSSDDNECNNREYVTVQQKYNKLIPVTNSKETVPVSACLFVVSKIDCIDPNKFPILNKYYDICEKTVKIFDDKYLTISIIQEKSITYIKISFAVNRDVQYKRGVLRHLKEVISLLPHN